MISMIMTGKGKILCLFICFSCRLKIGVGMKIDIFVHLVFKKLFIQIEKIYPFRKVNKLKQSTQTDRRNCRSYMPLIVFVFHFRWNINNKPMKPGGNFFFVFFSRDSQNGLILIHR